MPEDGIYFPVQVGKNGKPALGYTGDDTGDNISAKNPGYCELTGLYWAWKNLDCDYLGLVHYRRHFTAAKRIDLWRHRKTLEDKMSCVLERADLDRLLPKYEIIVPIRRKYYIETLYSHYGHTHYQEHLDVARDIISEMHPEYLESFDKVMRSRAGHMFNMYIMEKTLSDQYCTWLFDILFELEKRMAAPNLTQFQGRFYGRVSEIIFNVWLDYQVLQYGHSVKELRCIQMEKIHWLRKGTSFLQAKFFHRKYKRGD